MEKSSIYYRLSVLLPSVLTYLQRSNNHIYSEYSVVNEKPVYIEVFLD